MDDYAHKSLVPILWCVNEVIRKELSKEGEHLLDHLGKAQVTIRRLKGLAKALSSGNPQAEQFIPIGLLGKFELNGPKMVESLKTGEADKLADVVHEMASHAHSHLSLIKPSAQNCDPKFTKFMKLSKYSSGRYLKELEKNNFSILNPKMQRIGSQRDGILPIKLYFQKFLQ